MISLHIRGSLLLQTQPKEPKTLTNEELLSIEEKEMGVKEGPTEPTRAPSPSKMDQSEAIRNENPELSKVLSEEPSTGEWALVIEPTLYPGSNYQGLDMEVHDITVSLCNMNNTISFDI